MTVSVTNGTLDEIERVAIVYENSVSLLIADLTGGRQVINFGQFLAPDVATGTDCALLHNPTFLMYRKQPLSKVQTY